MPRCKCEKAELNRVKDRWICPTCDTEFMAISNRIWGYSVGIAIPNPEKYCNDSDFEGATDKELDHLRSLVASAKQHRKKGDFLELDKVRADIDKASLQTWEAIREREKQARFRQDEARHKEEARFKEERIKEEARLKEVARLKEEERLQQEARFKEERIKEEARLKEVARLKEEERLQQEARFREERIKEEARLKAEALLKEEERLQQEARFKEERIKEEARLKEVARLKEEERLQQEARFKEERIKEEERLREEDRKRREEEQARLEATDEFKRNKLFAAVRQIQPLVDKAINQFPEKQTELHATLAEIADAIKNARYESAASIIAKLEESARSLTNPPTVTSESVTSDTEQSTKSVKDEAYAEELRDFRDRQQQHEKTYLEVCRAMPDVAGKLQGLWNFADKQAVAGNFENARKTFDRLEQELEVNAEEFIYRTEILTEGCKKELLKEFLNRLSVPSERPEHLQRVEKCYEDAIDAANAAVDDKQVADAKSLLEKYRSEIESIKKELSKEAAELLPGLSIAKKPAEISDALWDAITKACDYVRRLLDVPHSKNIDQAKDCINKLPELIELANRAHVSRQTAETALQIEQAKVPSLIAASYKKALEEDAVYTDYDRNWKAVLGAPSDPSKVDSFTKSAESLKGMIPNLLQRVVQGLWDTEVPRHDSKRDNAASPLKAVWSLYGDEIKSSDPFKQYASQRTKKVTAADYESQLLQLGKTCDDLIALIRSAVQKNTERMQQLAVVVAAVNRIRTRLTSDESQALVEFEAQHQSPEAIASFKEKVTEWEERIKRSDTLKKNVADLLKNVQDFEARTCKLANVQTRSMLTELNAAIAGEPNTHTLTNVRQWEKNYDSRLESFNYEKRRVADARANKAKACSYLKERNVLGRGSAKPNDPPNQATVIETIGKATGTTLDDWKFTFDDLVAEMRNALLDGLMTLAELQKLKVGGGQSYIKSGNKHISVATSPEGSLFRVTKVHVSLEDRAEKGRPRFWFRVDNGLLTVGNPDGSENNPTGADVPANFAAEAEEFVREEAHKFKCRF